MVQGGQFAILREPVDLKDYSSIVLQDGWCFSWHKKLPVYRDAEKDVMLLGYAWQSMPGLKSPYEIINSVEYAEELLDAEPMWAGRYVLIIQGRVYLDASGLFGVFYSDRGVSSDVSILASAIGAKRSKWKPDEVVNWFPGPMTPYDDIRRLLPSQSFDYRNNQIHSRNLLPLSAPQYDDEQTLIESTTEIFCNSLRNMQALFPGKKMLMALTGGMDSRVLFAMANRAGLDFECFELEHDKMSAEDLTFPQVLCERTGRTFKYYPRNPERKSLRRHSEFLRHLSHMQKEEDITFYEYAQYQQLPKDHPESNGVVILRSSVYGIALDIYRHFIDEDSIDFQKILNKYELKEGSVEAEGFLECCEWIETHPQPISLANRFYWEQRSGSWDSENEHGFDIYDDIISLQPLNCRRLIYMFLQFPKEDRIWKGHHVKLIRYACPEISDIPSKVAKPPMKAKLETLGKEFHKGFRRLRRIGLARTATVYLNNFEKLKKSRTDEYIYADEEYDDETAELNSYEAGQPETPDVDEKEPVAPAIGDTIEFVPDRSVFATQSYAQQDEETPEEQPEDEAGDTERLMPAAEEETQEEGVDGSEEA